MTMLPAVNDFDAVLSIMTPDPDGGNETGSARAREDYVKAIYQLRRSEAVKAAEVARYLGVSTVAVSKAKKLLERDGYLAPSVRPTDPLMLTKRGRTLAVSMIRRHRLIETFLHRTLAMPLERVHREAERVEHVISDEVAHRLAIHLGMPKADPHGHLIPYDDDFSEAPLLASLADAPVGSEIRVAMVDDRDEAAIRELARQRVLPGYIARVLEQSDLGVTLRSFDEVLLVARGHAVKVQIEVADRA